jgi:hypothetical protein
MPTVLISPTNVVGSPSFGGHAWVYLQYALGLRDLGCEVYWLERFHPTGDEDRDAALRSTFQARMARHGLAEHTLLYTLRPDRAGRRPRPVFLDRSEDFVDAILRRAELLLNFHYAMAPELLARFRRTALVDIDPGLFQWWMSTGQLQVARHDLHLTIGETVGQPDALFPDCGLSWTRIRPPIWLPAWPVRFDASPRPFTTVSSWWGGGGSGEWVTDGKDVCYENNKRASFLAFVDLPRRTRESLELALAIGEGDPPEAATREAPEWRPEKPAPADATDYRGDAHDLRLLLEQGWGVRDAREVSGSPEDFRAYVQQSRGEFSCAKPSCMAFQNAWISDRTLCYLASGKPVVIQDTGPSATLPNGLGMFRFCSAEEAALALETIGADYPKHCRAAREIAEALFDSRSVLTRLLDAALG